MEERRRAKRSRREEQRQKREAENSQEKNIWRELLGWLIYIAVIIVLTYLIITFVGQRTRVSGESMMTTLYDGDQLIVDKISYRFREPKRYEIIVFPYERQENTYYIKRIMGLPGETVQIIDGYFYVNGEKLEDGYCDETMDNAGIAAEPLALGDDEYFVLGDNRNHSSDSRVETVGVIKRNKMLGRAWIRIWPFKRFGIIRHE